MLSPFEPHAPTSTRPQLRKMIGTCHRLLCAVGSTLATSSSKIWLRPAQRLAPGLVLHGLDPLVDLAADRRLDRFLFTVVEQHQGVGNRAQLRSLQRERLVLEVRHAATKSPS